MKLKINSAAQPVGLECCGKELVFILYRMENHLSMSLTRGEVQSFLC
jgi:hypothetical protein